MEPVSSCTTAHLQVRHVSCAAWESHASSHFMSHSRPWALSGGWPWIHQSLLTAP